MTSKRSYISGNIASTQQFRHCLLAALSKYSSNHTTKTATEEMKELMTEHITNTERMNIFLSTVAEQNEHMKSAQRKEQIKLFALAAQIFEEALLPFLPKVASMLQRKLREGDNHIQASCAQSFGALVRHLLLKSQPEDQLSGPIMTKEDREQFANILKHMYSNIQHPSKLIQIGGALALTKVIQNAPVQILNLEIERICCKLHECLASNTCKSHSSLLECLISLILSVESEFEQYAPNFLPLLLQNMANTDWNTRKMAIDVVYTLAAIIQEVLEPFKYQVLEVLNHCRFDKIKPVRQAAIEAINVIKEIASPQDQEVAKKQIEEKRQKELARKMKSVRVPTPGAYSSVDKFSSGSVAGIEDVKVDKQQAPPKRFLKKSQMSELPAPAKETKKAKQKSIFKGPANPNFFKNTSVDEGVVLVKEGPRPMTSPEPMLVEKPAARVVERPVARVIETKPKLEERPMTMMHHPDHHQHFPPPEEQKQEIDEESDRKVNELAAAPRMSHVFTFNPGHLESREPGEEQEQEHEQFQEGASPAVNGDVEMKDETTPLSDVGAKSETRPYEFREEGGIKPAQSTPNLRVTTTEEQPQPQRLQSFDEKPDMRNYFSQGGSERGEESNGNSQSLQAAAWGQLAAMQAHMQAMEQKIEQLVGAVSQLRVENKALWERVGGGGGGEPQQLQLQKPPEMSEKLRWERAVSLLKERKLSEAYEAVLACGNDLMLIRLMGRTGVVLGELAAGTKDLTTSRVLAILRERDFVEFLQPWVEAAEEEAGPLQSAAQELGAELRGQQ